MEVLRRNTSHLSSGNWLMEETKSNAVVAVSGKAATWTATENKAFENALAVYDDNTPDPGYITSPFTLDWTGGGGVCNGFKPGQPVCNKRSLAGRSPELERKKGVPWTEEEHKLFLMGLKKYGKGDWRNISRNFVITRTPTQVASHAQKYFIRQLSGGKDKRRASIHDITTVNIEDEASLETNKSSNIVVGEQRFPWNQTDINKGSHADAFSITIGNAINGVHSYSQALLGGFNNGDSCYDAQNAMFQL